MRAVRRVLLTRDSERRLETAVRAPLHARSDRRGPLRTNARSPSRSVGIASRTPSRSVGYGLRTGARTRVTGRACDRSPPARVCRVPRGASARLELGTERKPIARSTTRDAARRAPKAPFRVRRRGPNALAKRRSRRVAPARRSDDAPGGRRGASAPGAAEGGAGPANAGRESGVPLSPGAQCPRDTSLNCVQPPWKRCDLQGRCARGGPGPHAGQARTRARTTPGRPASRGALLDLRDPRLDRVAPVAPVSAARHSRQQAGARLRVDARSGDGEQLGNVASRHEAATVAGGVLRRVHTDAHAPGASGVVPGHVGSTPTIGRPARAEIGTRLVPQR